MTKSQSLPFILEDLTHAINQLRSTVADLHERVAAAEREPRTVTLEDLCTASGLSVDTVKQHIQKGNMPGRRIGDRYVIPDLEFDAWRRGEWKPRHESIQPVRNFRHQIPKAG